MSFSPQSLNEWQMVEDPSRERRLLREEARRRLDPAFRQRQRQATMMAIFSALQRLAGSPKSWLILGVLGLLAVFLLRVISLQPEASPLTETLDWQPLSRPLDMMLAQDAYRLKALPETGLDQTLQQMLDDRFQQLSNPYLKPHVYYLNLKTGQYAGYQPDHPIAAASVIKLPVLLEYFRAVGEGKLSLQTPLAYSFLHQTGGSGELQYKAPGFSIPSVEVARTMIQISDNSATNMLIDTLGGMDELNQRFERMGLRQTVLRNWLPDLTGTNEISMRDMAKILYNIGYTRYLCPECRVQALLILKGTHNNRLIPAGLPPKTFVAHKTGDIGTSLGDSTLIIHPNGTPYLLCMQVGRSHNDYSAKALIIEVSRMISDYVQNGALTSGAHLSNPSSVSH